MKSKIILLILLLFINICLTIYLIYKCFNNKIIEGARDPTGISGRIKKTANSGADALKRESERIAEETRREAERIAEAARQAQEAARREAQRIAEEARRAFEQLVFDSFEKILGPINRFFSTVQNTTSLLEEQGATIDLTQAVELAGWEDEEARIRAEQANKIKKVFGGGGIKRKGGPGLSRLFR